jgi:hypothetical protein
VPERWFPSLWDKGQGEGNLDGAHEMLSKLRPGKGPENEVHSGYKISRSRAPCSFRLEFAQIPTHSLGGHDVRAAWFPETQ